MISVNNGTMRFKSIPLIDDKTSSFIKENNIEINDIKNNLSEYEKNPNFYRNKQMIAVAAAIVTIAALLSLTYLCWAIAVPLSISQPVSGTLFAGGILFPIAIACWGFSEVSCLFKSLDGDKKALKKLEDKDKIEKDKIREKIKLCDTLIENSIAATTKNFTEESWKAMKNISTRDYSTILDELDTDEKKEATWKVNQPQIISFRKEAEWARQGLERIIK